MRTTSFIAITLLVCSSAVAAAWQNIGPAPPSIEGPIAVDPGSGTIYIGTFGGGVLKSVDDGRTFRAANGGLNSLALAITSIAMNPANPDHVVIGTGGAGIFRTTDGGATWSATSEVGTVPTYIAVDPNNTQVWYAGFGVGSVVSVQKSVDGGATWVRADAGIPSTTVWSIVVDPWNDGVVYAGSGNAGAFKTTDGGATWRPLAIEPVVWTLAIDPTDSNIVYAGTNGDGVFKSTDAGATFVRVGSPDSGVILSLAIDPDQPDHLYAGTVSGGLALSKDGGTHWQKTNIRDGIVVSLTMTGAGDLYAGTGFQGALTNKRAHPCGKSSSCHEKLFNPIAGADLHAINAQNVFSLTIDPRDSNHLILGTNDGGLLGSYDGGAHWLDVGRGLLSRAPRKAVYHPNPERGLVGSFDGGGLYMSADNGQSWTRHMFGSPAVYVWTVAVDPSTLAIYAGTKGEGLWRSTDDGASFMRIDGKSMNQARSIAFDPEVPGKLLVGANSGVWRSLDGGATFTKVAAAFTLNVTFDPTRPGVVYAETQTAGILKSTDGGATFAAINSGLTMLRMSRSAPVQVDRDGTLYASTEGAGVFKSNDGGSTWRAINDGLSELTVFGLTLDPNQPGVLYATGARGVFKTTSGGE